MPVVSCRPALRGRASGSGPRGPRQVQGLSLFCSRGHLTGLTHRPRPTVHTVRVPNRGQTPSPSRRRSQTPPVPVVEPGPVHARQHVGPTIRARPSHECPIGARLHRPPGVEARPLRHGCVHHPPGQLHTGLSFMLAPPPAALRPHLWLPHHRLLAAGRLWTSRPLPYALALTPQRLDAAGSTLPCESPRRVLGTVRAGRPAIGIRRSAPNSRACPGRFHALPSARWSPSRPRLSVAGTYPRQSRQYCRHNFHQKGFTWKVS